MGYLGRPTPRPKIFDKYTEGMTPAAGDKHIGLTLRCAPDWAYLDALRAEWDGPMIVKGVLDPRDVQRLIDAGADAIRGRPGAHDVQGLRAPGRGHPVLVMDDGTCCARV